MKTKTKTETRTLKKTDAEAMAATDYGNSTEFALEMLCRHWIKQHNGKPGQNDRPYECEVCRGLAARMSSSNSNNMGAVPLSYLHVVMMAKRWFETEAGAKRLTG